VYLKTDFKYYDTEPNLNFKSHYLGIYALNSHFATVVSHFATVVSYFPCNLLAKKSELQKKLCKEKKTAMINQIHVYVPMQAM
jgi:hypothetical protein